MPMAGFLTIYKPKLNPPLSGGHPDTNVGMKYLICSDISGPKNKEDQIMNIIKYQTPKFNSLMPNFFDIFDGILGNDIAEFSGSDYLTKAPSVNIIETENSYDLELAVPGFNKENISINVENDVLTIKGEDKTEEEDNKKHYIRHEFSFNSFTRSFNLNDQVRGDKIGADYKDGILTITIPKKEEAKKGLAREIKIS